MPNTLITHFFAKQDKAGSNPKKRPSPKLDQAEDPDWTPTNATKRPKVTTKGKAKEKRARAVPFQPDVRPPDSDVTLVSPPQPLQTPGASSSKFKTPAAKRELKGNSLDGPDVTMVGITPDARVRENVFSRYRSPPPSSSAPSSSRRYGHKPVSREESIVPATPEHESLFPSAGNPVTPIRLTLKPLSQTWSDETVDSSQSQEDVDLDEYGGCSINLTHTPFGAARSNCATKGSEDFTDEAVASVDAMSSPAVSHRVIESSQLQSQYPSTSNAPPKRTSTTATILLTEDSLELIESSQSQEKEMNLNTVLPQRCGWQYKGRSTTPDIPQPSQLKKSSSLTKELPVRRLSLHEDEDSGPMADDRPDPLYLTLGEGDFTPRRSFRQTQEWDTPSQRHVASTLLEFDYPHPDQSCPLVSPTRSIRIGISSQSGFASQPFGLNQQSPSGSYQRSSPSQVISFTHSDALGRSQTEELTPLNDPHGVPTVSSPESVPLEVKTFHTMFEEGEEEASYPPDFPMSLRI